MDRTVLECKSLTKSYKGVTALDHVNLSIPKGRIVGLLGANGSGKTTLLKIINGLLVPDEGEVLINGLAPSVETKKRISYLPDASYLNDWMTSEQLIHFFSEFYSDFDEKKAFTMLDQLKLNRKMKLKTMSKGMKEKLQLILVMSRKADLYCLDEPIGGVDPASREYILNTIITNYNEDASVIISTHLIADVEMVLDDAIFLNQGKVLLHSSVDEIRSKQNMSIDAYFREVFRCLPN
ncbi:ABC transporter ATP-binding protein [Clostridium sp. Marseille-P299]|uniref:ABC transporter ATP-binding protein n=1 Tax=Clostridium sp. Marseille-P299 TaxID=1805477 RepID=UPI00082B8CA3|nr:ABC transporter ATP-binding protein [Clostridium sp. Marseille-P299]